MFVVSKRYFSSVDYDMIESVMNLFSNSQHAVDSEVDLILDIRSGGVGVCLVTTDTETPKIHWSDRFSVDFLAEHDTDRLLHMTKRALSEAVTTARDKGFQKIKDRSTGSQPGEIYCYFAAPWQIGSPQDITIEHDSPFEVNQDRLQLAKEKAENLFLENSLENFGTSEENLKPLTTALLGCWCNGYRLQQPKSVLTDKLKVSTYVSMVPTRIKSVVESTVTNTFHPNNITYHSFTAAIHNAFTKCFSHPKTFLIINVDEEMTQLIIVNSGVLVGSVSYPVGSHFLIRELAESLNVPAADARARLRQQQKSEADKQSNQQVEEIIARVRDKWQSLLIDTLDEFSADVSIPEYAFVLANHDVSKTFRDFVKDVDVSEHVLDKDSLRVHEVTDDLLQIHVATAEDHSDHYLSIASIMHSSEKSGVKNVI